MSRGDVDAKGRGCRGITARMGALLVVALGGMAPVAAHAAPLTIEWVRQFEVVADAASGPGNVYDTSFAIDGLGNLHVLGAFAGTVDFDPGPETITLTSVDDGELFIAKLDPDGAFLWARHLESAQGTNGHIDTPTMSLAVDPDGNVFVGGTFQGGIDMDPGPATHRLTSISSFGDGFVVKFDSEGAFAWAQHLVATQAAITGIAAGANGNVCIEGNYFGAADVDPGPDTFELSSLLSTSHFVTQWDADGGFLWANQLRANTVASSAVGRAIAMDASGNTYTAGTFQFSVEFDTDPTKALVASSTGTFLAKYDATGAVSWIKQFDQTDMDTGAYSLDVATDDIGTIATTGVFSGGIDADPGPATANLSTAPGEQAIYAIKLDAAGNLLWANQTQATSADTGVLTSSAADTAGNVYTVGQFAGTIDLDPGPEPFEATSAGEGDIYVRALDPTGAFDDALHVGGAGFDSATKVIAGPPGTVYVLGEFTGTVDFDTGPGVSTITASPNGHTFIMKVSPVPCAPPPAPIGLTASDGTNPDAIEIAWEAVAGANVEYQIFRNTTDDPAGASPISDWISDTTFLDTTAAAPTPGPLNCSGQPILSFNTHYYWIPAREAGAFCASELSASVSGFRGSNSPVATAGVTPNGPDAEFGALLLVILLGLGLGGRERKTATR